MCVCVTDVPECVLGGCVQAGVSMNVVCMCVFGAGVECGIGTRL